jgi:hypothetical protein
LAPIESRLRRITDLLCFSALRAWDVMTVIAFSFVPGSIWKEYRIRKYKHEVASRPRYET